MPVSCPAFAPRKPVFMLLAAIEPIFLIILAGFVVRRMGVLSVEGDATLLSICVNVLYPCLIVVTVVGNPSLHESQNVWMPPLAGFLSVVVGYLACYAAGRLLRLTPGADLRTFVYVTGLYNYGYMAIPVVEKLFGAKTLGVLFTHNLGVEVALWLGASLILASKAHRGERPWWRSVLNAPVVSILASLALNFAIGGRVLPDWIANGARMLGGSAIPMALLLTGATLADFLGELRAAHSGLATLTGACLLRMGLLPLAFIGMARWLPCSVELKQVLVVQSAMPCAMLPIVLAKHYGGNAGMAVQIVFATTALALLTIPSWIHFGMALAGL